MAEPAAAFLERRRRLGAALSAAQLPPAVFCSGWARPRNFAHNVYPFRAESHFLYFVGRHLEGALLVVDGSQARLFVTEQDAEMALWTGPEPSLEELARELGLEVRSLDDFEAPSETCCLPPQDEESAGWLSSLLERELAAQSGPELEGFDARLADVVVELRLVHDTHALAGLRQAGRVSAAAHVVGLGVTLAASHEYVVRGAMEGAILSAGYTTSYASIVSTRGEILHNNESRGALQPGQLLLCDVGAESPEGWAGDITRTWPTSGRFSSSQRDLYELVLDVQKAAIAGARSGVRFLDLHRESGRQMARGLVELGILRGDPGDLYERGVAAVFYPHGLGHLLGLDVHDMEDLGDRAGYAPGTERSLAPGESALRLDRVLQADQVVTIEPGFYQSPLLLERARRDAAISNSIDWKRLSDFADVRGIRIEDDVRITDAEAEVLSAAAPKEVSAVEDMISG